MMYNKTIQLTVSPIHLTHLKRLIILQNLLDSSGTGVVLVTDDIRVEDTGGGVEGIDGRVNAKLGNA